MFPLHAKIILTPTYNLNKTRVAAALTILNLSNTGGVSVRGGERASNNVGGGAKGGGGGSCGGVP